LEDQWTVKGVSRDERQPSPPPVQPLARRALPWSEIASITVGLVGVAALAATAWSYADTQRELTRLSTDIAQIKLSLELFGQQAGTSTASTELSDIANRLAILEQEWRDAPAPAAAATVPTPTAATPAESAGDCMPTGTRFLVAAGDSYPICGSPATIEVAAVDNGFITLGNGAVIAAGASIALPGTGCMVSLFSAGTEGMSDYAELRVTC
jgi:HAMP domain-containing protein